VEVTEEGLPVRRDWAKEYNGKALVIYGHTPVPEPVFVNNTVDIDQGCVMGEKLTALRYPELETLQVPAFAVYYERAGFTKKTIERITNPNYIVKHEINIEKSY